MTVAKQIGYRKLASKDSLVVRKNHAAALISGFPIRKHRLHIKGICAPLIKCVYILSFKIDANRVSRILYSKIRYLFDKIADISRKSRYAGTEDKVEFLIICVIQHLLEVFSAFFRGSGLSFVFINLDQFPIRVFRYLISIISGLVFYG